MFDSSSVLKRKVFSHRQRGLPFTTGLSECKYWPTLHHEPLKTFDCKSRALTKIWQLPIRHYSCLMKSWSDVASMIRASDRGDWLELREKMSIPMKEVIINLTVILTECWSIFMLLYCYFKFSSIFQFLCGKLPFVFGKNEELSLWSQYDSQTLNSHVGCCSCQQYYWQGSHLGVLYDSQTDYLTWNFLLPGQIKARC